MAKNLMNAGIPTDEPILLRPGVAHREADYHGNAKFYALPPEAPERADKGDFGEMSIPGLEPRPLTHNGLPFELKPKV